MRIVKYAKVKEYWNEHASAKSSLERWYKITKQTDWNSLVELRGAFNDADEVKVGSGRKVVVFDICGNNYRLICAVHFNTKAVFVLRFLTHAEYDKNNWKKTL